MSNFSGGEALLLLVIALVVLGPERLPKVAREAGRWIGELRRMSSGFQDELRSAIDFDPDDERPAHYRDGDRPFGPGEHRLRPALPSPDDGDTDLDTDVRAGDASDGSDAVDTDAPSTAEPPEPVEEGDAGPARDDRGDQHRWAG